MTQGIPVLSSYHTQGPAEAAAAATAAKASLQRL